MWLFSSFSDVQHVSEVSTLLEDIRLRMALDLISARDVGHGVSGPSLLFSAMEVLAHTTLRLLPNDCKAMVDLAGFEEESFSCPSQRDQVVTLYNEAISTGHPNFRGLLQVKWAMGVLFAPHRSVPSGML